MRLLIYVVSVAMLQGGVVELLGPSGRQAARNQTADRQDGTGQFLEVAIFPAPGVNGFSRVQVWTSKREAGKYTRVRLQEKELQIPEPLRIARELYDFPFSNFSSPNAALAENRIAVLCGGTEFTVRLLNPVALTVGRSIVLPPLARQIALRPGIGEVWVTHAGTSNQISISDPVSERVVTSIPFRLNPQAVPVGLFFSPSGRTAYAVVRNPESVSDRGYVFVIDPATRVIRNQISLGTTTPQSAVLSPDGSTIFVMGTSLNDLVQARRVVRRIALPRLIQPQNLEFTPNGDVMFVRDILGQLATHLDPETGEILDTQQIPAGPGVSLVR
ncbi:MAG: hypothetical protein NTW74_15515 [Acidobacteria bacterium]|nr:hypothetical protein [Acidobacteriota bacterium]